MTSLPLPRVDLDKVYSKITNFIKEEVENSGCKGVVIGLSGGVDSSTVATLCVKALGRDRVYALMMPDTRITPKEDIRDALNLASTLKVKYYEVPIDAIYDAYANNLPFYSDELRIANGNLRARIRMSILYYYANSNNLLVAGTGDKSEILIGYFTKYGDGGVDILPIGDLYKTQVRKLAKYLGLPDDIAFKPSSPRLWKGQLAEKELGLTYEEIDSILYHYVDLKYDISKVLEITGLSKEKVESVVKRVEATKHKRSLPPYPKLEYL